MKGIIMRIAVFASLILTALGLPGLAEDLDPASVKFLAQTVGTWNIEESATKADAQTTESAGPGTYRSVLDGRYVEHVSRAARNTTGHSSTLIVATSSGVSRNTTTVS